MTASRECACCPVDEVVHQAPLRKVPRQAKSRAQLKLAELRFGDAIVHEQFGRGVVSALESNRAEGSPRVDVYWLNPLVGPPWRGPHVRASELAHDWDLQAEWQDTWEHHSDDEWEP